MPQSRTAQGLTKASKRSTTCPTVGRVEMPAEVERNYRLSIAPKTVTTPESGGAHTDRNNGHGDTGEVPRLQDPVDIHRDSLKSLTESPSVENHTRMLLV